MRKRKYFSFLVLLMVLIIAPGCFPGGKSRQVRQKERLTIQAERKQKKNFRKARDKELKHRFDIQTDKTQKRMKQSRKQARSFNDSFSHRKSIFDIFKRKSKRRR